MKYTILLLALFFSPVVHVFPATDQKPLKILHISFHRGCLRDFEQVAQELALNVTSLFVQDMGRDFDGVSQGNAIYNISKKRAQLVWDKHKEYFNSFDMIITSDTAPLSRIFLQNDWKKPLIIWVCNRFDYYDHAASEGDFPDPAYYALFQKAATLPHVRVVAYTPYEHVYMHAKGVYAGNTIIKPIGICDQALAENNSAIPPHIEQEKSLFLYPRMDQHQIAWVQEQCKKVGLSTYSGVYQGPADLKKFKGIIYFPYQWSNVALFENMQQGCVHFVPSQRFINELVHNHAPVRFVTLDSFALCEWYMPENSPYIVYFDSWRDLKHKATRLKYDLFKQRILAKGRAHRDGMLARWRALFDELQLVASDNDRRHE